MDVKPIKCLSFFVSARLFCIFQYFTLVSLFFSCGLSPSKPEKQTDWILHYKQAKEDKDCESLISLSKKKHFRLKNIALIRAYQFCPKHSINDFNWKSFPDWMKKSALSASLKRASKNKSIKSFIDSAWELSRISPHYDEKVRYTLQALRAARKYKMDEAAELEEELYSLSPSRKRNPSFSDYIEVAKDFQKRGLYSEASYYYKKVLNSKKSSIDMKHTCFVQLKKNYKLSKKKKNYERAVRQHDVFQRKYRYKNKKAGKYYFNSQIELAKTYWNLENYSKALKILNSLSKQKNPPLKNIYWLKGKIYENINKNVKAMHFFDKSYKLFKIKKGELYETLVWDMVWNLKGLEKYAHALELLTELEENSKTPSAQYTFWRANLLENLDRKNEAVSAYQKLIEEAPFSFHGIIAHYKAKSPLKLDLEYSNESSSYKIVDDLFLAGENKLLFSFMDYKINEYKYRSDLNQKEMFSFFKSSAKAGFYLPFFQFIGSLSTKEKSLFIKKYAHIIFPTVYQEEVKKAENLFNTSSELIYSIIRQESAFNPRALSPARAMGLMQMIPSVAKSVAKKQGIAYRRLYDLYDPQTNILIGTAHLQNLFSRYGGYFILNTAIYNAGHRPVLRWMKKFSTQEPIEFIQNIPYQETRTYVRLIMRNFIIYKLLNSPKKSMDFPEWILDLPKNQAMVSLTP